MARGGLHGWTRLRGGGVLARFHETDPTVACGSLDHYRASAARLKVLDQPCIVRPGDIIVVPIAPW